MVPQSWIIGSLKMYQKYQRYKLYHENWHRRLVLWNKLTASLLWGKTPPTSVLWPSGLRLQNTSTASLQKDKTPPTSVLWPSRLRLQNTSTASLQKDKTPPTSVPDITQNYRIVMRSTDFLQSLPGPLWALSISQIELFDI